MGIYQICVSGAAKGESAEEGKELARAAGAAIAKAGHSLLTGATTGLPEDAAAAYLKADGKSSLGISPAATKVEHILKYRLPIKHYHNILYTGMHYIGRDVLMINSADAVISVGGRLGTLHEFTIAIETQTPTGLLQGAGGVSDYFDELLRFKASGKEELVIFEDNAEVLVEKLTKLLDKLHKPYKNIYN